MRSMTIWSIPMAGLALASLSLAACGDVRWLHDQSGKGGPPDPGPSSGGGGTAGGSGDGGTTPAPSCVDGQLGGATNCQDVGALKLASWQACQDRGLILEAYTPTVSCGTDLFRNVSYTCCPQPEPPPPPPPVDADPPPPSTGACILQVEGSQSTCQSTAAWKQEVSQLCAASGLQLTDYRQSVSCGGDSYRYLTFVCCAPAGQPAAPTANSGPVPGPAHFAAYKCCLGDTECTEEIQGDDATCQDEAAWEMDAARSCSSQGRTVKSFSLFGSC